MRAQSRATVRIATAFPDAAGRRFAAIVESQNGPASFVVERAMYTTVGGDTWAGGTNALGTPIDVIPPGADWSGVSITATHPQVLEQGLDGGVFTFTRGTAGAALAVAYTVSGSATPGSDYRALTGTVTIPAGATSTTLAIAPVDDTLAEPTETITLSLLPSTQYGITAPASATISLQDNDTVVVPDSDIDASRFLTQATFVERRRPCSRCGRWATTPGWPRRRRRRPARSSASSIRSTPATCPRTTCRRHGSPTPPTPPISCGCGSPTR